MIGILNAVVIAAISGLVGGCIGGLVAWGGIRVRLDHLESRLTRLSDNVVYTDVCDAVRLADLERHKEIMSSLRDIRQDISHG